MKTKILSKSILVLMVSALIAMSSGNLLAQRESRHDDSMRDSAKAEKGIPNLTADQKTKIESLKVKHIKEVTPLRNELMEKMAHLKTLGSVEKPDRDAINKTIDEISALQNKIMKLRVNHRLDVSSLLTDEQKIYFNEHHREHMGMGDGMGDGMGKGMKKRMHQE